MIDIKKLAIEKPKLSLSITTAAVILLGLATCGDSSVCAKPEVLNTVQRLFVEREFGPLKLEEVISVDPKSATLLSSDRQSKTSRCTALVSVDLLQLQGLSDDKLPEARRRAAQNGQQTNKEILTNYVVQTLASGQNYITLQP